MNEKLLNELVSSGVLSSKNADEIRKEAKTSKGKVRCLQYAHDVMKRSDHPVKAKWLTKLKQMIEKLKWSHGASLV